MISHFEGQQNILSLKYKHSVFSFIIYVLREITKLKSPLINIWWDPGSNDPLWSSWFWKKKTGVFEGRFISVKPQTALFW